jgi:hypothetical protein
MARIIWFYIPSSYKPASKNRHAQGGRGKLIQFPPVAFPKSYPRAVAPALTRESRMTDSYHA